MKLYLVQHAAAMPKDENPERPLSPAGREDVQKIAIPVLRHRISTNFQAQAEGLSNEDIIERLLSEIPTPEIAKFEK